jgi:tRNA threonylcarbamoyladenosine biosynthesis protein TsaB
LTLVGFDTSMPVTAACVLLPDGRSFATPAPGPERLRGAPEHSAELLPALAALLGEASVEWDDVRGLAVGVGPGTFTGLRIGIATARALAQALGIGVRPVSSLAALAAGLEAYQEAYLEAYLEAGAESEGRPLLSLIDARRRQVFAALYRPGDFAQPEWGPLALGREDLVGRVAEAGAAPLAAGDWALESRTDLEAAGAIVPPADSGLHAVNALHVCRLAEAVDPIPPDQVTPVYVRLPDAEINRRDD